jgi:hypothetical protein
MDRGQVALEVGKAEIESAQQLINFMEKLAHPMGVAAVDPSARTGGLQ